ncbi:MAG: hypothetical protein JNM43_10130 [Planctomycetaceae bacterium]|nr:hypothetical protein [Planctomycetaceae bacterium]
MRHQVRKCSVVLLTLVSLVLLSAQLFWFGASYQGHHWIAANLSPGEAAAVRHLAAQIAAQIAKLDHEAGPTSNAFQSQSLVRQAAGLSIRQAAALAILLQTDHGIAPLPWVRLAAQREHAARQLVEERLRHFESREGKFPGLEITLRGPEWLQDSIGTQLLGEVTGVGIWQFHDSDIPAATQFSDSDVALLLALPGLERIWAENSQLTDRGASELSQLPRLSDIDLAGCRHLTDGAIRSLAACQNLRALDVSHIPKITDAGLRSLHNCDRLQELGLSHTGISSDSLPVIAGLRQLRILKLDKTNILTGLEQLESLKQLEVLSLSHLGSEAERVSSSSLDFLSQLRHLRMLDLSETAVEHLKLSNLPALTDLSLGHSSLRKLTLRNLPRLRQLSTGYPSTRKDIRLESTDLYGLTDLSRLTLHVHSPEACTEFAGGLRTLTSLTWLHLPVAAISDTLSEELGRLPKLEGLILEEADLTDRQLQSILTARRLRSLDCGGQNLTQQSVQAAVNSGRLENLQFRRLRLSERVAWKARVRLKRLSFRDCNIKELELSRSDSLDTLSVSLSTLDQLRIHQCSQLRLTDLSESTVQTFLVEDCPRVTNVFSGFTRLDVVRLSNLPQLEQLTIQEHSTARVLHLSQLPKLRNCSFWAAEIQSDLLTELPDLPSLKVLDISNTPLQDDAISLISRMSQLHTLTASSHIRRAGLEQLLQIPNLSTIMLYWNDTLDWTKEEAEQMFRNRKSVTVFP